LVVPDARDGMNRPEHGVGHATVVVDVDVGEDVGLAPAGVGLRDTGNLSQCGHHFLVLAGVDRDEHIGGKHRSNSSCRPWSSLASRGSSAFRRRRTCEHCRLRSRWRSTCRPGSKRIQGTGCDTSLHSVQLGEATSAGGYYELKVAISSVAGMGFPYAARPRHPPAGAPNPPKRSPAGHFFATYLDQANRRLLAGRPIAEDDLVLWVGEQHPLK
jgi:hypothetical protein